MKEMTKEFKENLSTLLMEAFDKAIQGYDFFDISEETAEEKVLMVPDEIGIYDYAIVNTEGQGLKRLKNKWVVWDYGSSMGAERHKLTPTTFGELELGDVYCFGESVSDNIEDYEIKTSKEGAHYWNNDNRDGQWEVCSIMRKSLDYKVFKVEKA